MSTAIDRALRVTNLYLSNWRNFTSVHVQLERRAFLVGPNASGKSNFLDALRFLRDIASIGGGFQEAVRKRNGISHLRCLAARRYSDISIGVDIGNQENPRLWTYYLSFSQDNLRRPILKEEKVLKDGAELLVRPIDKDKHDPQRLTQTYLEQISANLEFREISNFLAGIRYMHIVPQLVREPDRSVGKTNDPYGGDFLEQIARTVERTKISRLRRIRDALSVAVPQLRELEMYRDDRGTPHLRYKYDHWRPHGAWQTEEDFSDGTLRLMGLLWALMDGVGPLLLEEPELSLHPEVIKYIPQMFARIQRSSGRQVLVSTHSADLLRDAGIGLDEVILLEPGREGTSVSLANKITEIKNLLEGGLSIAEAVIPRTRPDKVEQLSLFEF